MGGLHNRLPAHESRKRVTMRHRFQASSRWLLSCAAVLAVLAMCAVPFATAQTLVPGAKLPGAEAGQVDSGLVPATAYDPARLRTQLLGIHGFTRAQLDAASTNVPQILMAWIDHPTESHFIRRQAIKALQLYPSDAVFGFIRERLPLAPPSLQHLYVTDLKDYVPTHPQEVQDLVLPLLSSPRVTVRHAAVDVAGQMKGSGNVVARLQERLSEEPDPGVKKDIERQLAP